MEQRLWRGLPHESADVDSTIDKKTVEGTAYSVVVDQFGLSYLSCRASNILLDGRVDGLQQGDDFETDFIAHDIRHKVGTVSHIGLMEAFKKADNLGTGNAKQWTNDMTVARSDACQSVDACTTNKIHEERLDGIILMVSHTDVIGSDIQPQLLEISIAQFACRHLNAYLMYL